MESWDLVNLPETLPCCHFRNQTPMITTQCRISGHFIKQQWLCTLWFLTHTPCWHDTNWDNLLLVLGLKRFNLLHPVGTCEPIHVCFPMGKSPFRGTTRVNLDPSPTGFQELHNYLCNCSGIRVMSIPSRKSWLHTLTFSLLWLTTKTVLKGQRSHSTTYGKLDTRYL
jgi:hypothetical protein